MDFDKKRRDQAKLLIRPYKQCPECSERLPINTKKCTQCGQRVGRIQADGKAAKPIDWKAYILAFLCVWLFIFYFRWAFL